MASPKSYLMYIEGKCQTTDCKYFEKSITIPWKSDDSFDLEHPDHSSTLKCSECENHIDSISALSFSDCRWKYYVEVHSPKIGKRTDPDNDVWYKSSITNSLQFPSGTNLMSLKVTVEPTGPDKLKRYKMNKSPHGVCLIINIISFKDSSSDRHGAQNDSTHLKQTFQNLDYLVHLHENKTAGEINEIVHYYGHRYDHSECDSFIVCLMSHGNHSNVIFGRDNELVNVQDLVDTIKDCPTLAGKPKMFFIQACRGSSESPSLTVADLPQKDNAPKPFLPLVPDEAVTIPHDADVVIVNSTSAGKVAYRNSTHGSHFIAILCQVLNENAKHLSLNQMIAIVTEQICKIEAAKQCCGAQNSLRFELSFFAAKKLEIK